MYYNNNNDKLFNESISYYEKMSLKDWSIIRTEKFWFVYSQLKNETQRKQYILKCIKEYFNDY